MWISPKLARFGKFKTAAVNIVDESVDTPRTVTDKSLAGPVIEEEHSPRSYHPEDSQRKTAEEHTSVIFAIKPPPDVADEICREYPKLNIDPDELHVTLVYVGKSLTDEQVEIANAVGDSVSSSFGPLNCKLQGVGVFDHVSDGGRPVYASVDCIGLAEFRTALVDGLRSAGVEISDDYDFTPHMTLGYIDPESFDFASGSPGVEWISVDFILMDGDNHVTFTFNDDGIDKEAGGFGVSLKDLTTGPDIGAPVDNSVSEAYNEDNTSEDPDLHLGTVEAPYSGSPGPIPVDEDADKEFNITRAASFRMADIVAVALPDNSGDENEYEDDSFRADQSIPRDPAKEDLIY